MRHERPSRIMMFYALLVSGVASLVYCLSIALFVNPEMDEYALIIALPFLMFIFINLMAVYRGALPLDYIVSLRSDATSLGPSQKVRLHRAHIYLTQGLFPLLIASTIVIHFITMWFEDGSLDFLSDPDSWSLLLNRSAMFLLVAIIQGSVFDKVISKLKDRLALQESLSDKSVGLFRRLAWMLLSLVLFLGSSIPIFSTMRFDRLIDQAIPSIAINLDESEDVTRDIPALIAMLQSEKLQFVAAQSEFDQLTNYLQQRLAEGIEAESMEEIAEEVSDMYDRLPLMQALEDGMDVQNTVSYAFIMLTLLAGLIMSFIFSQAFGLQIQMVRRKIAAMLAGDKSVTERLNVTGIGETASLAADFNRVLDYNKEINDELLRVDKIKDAFLANVSHELKTPLHGIIGITESLVDGVAGDLPPYAHQNLQLINASGRRLTSLVNDILDFSKLREHDIYLILKPLDLRTLVDVVIEMSRPLLVNPDVKLVNEVPADLPAAEGDENRLQQVLLNLVGNAIKFTRRGRIAVSAELADNKLLVHVSDTGIGIAADKLETIFQSFEQADTSISREYGGSGLGLSISQNLVQLHGGNLSLSSEPGVGSRFTFNLPASTAAKQKLSGELNPVTRLHQAVATGEELEPEIVPLESGEVYTILIVDDEPVNLTVLSNHLSMGGYRVIKAADGVEALEVFAQESPDLVLLDIMMPRMSGYEVCRELRERMPINTLPIIMLTAKDQVQDLTEGFSAGASDYIAKPFTKKELLSRIKTHLELAQINRVYSDFVPSEYMKFLGHESILDVKLGDNIHREMTIMFADIRSYTSMSEALSPQENFDFINEYLAVMGPCIKNNNGFVNHYLGDGMMALFPHSAEDAVRASIEMLSALDKFNKLRSHKNLEPIKVGVGLHFGRVIFGIIGDVFRKSGNVISDDVNISSRLEGLTKYYGSSLIASQSVLENLDNREHKHPARFLGNVVVKGKSNVVPIYELLEVEAETTRHLKLQTQQGFVRGLEQYFAREFGSAADFFRKVLNANPEDNAAQIYLQHCVNNLMSQPADDWSGAVVISEK